MDARLQDILNRTKELKKDVVELLASTELNETDDWVLMEFGAKLGKAHRILEAYRRSQEDSKDSLKG